MKNKTGFITTTQRLISLISITRLRRLIYYLRAGQLSIITDRVKNLINIKSLEATTHTLYAPPNHFDVLEFPKFNNPLVSIIIPVYNHWKTTHSCLASILENTHEIPYEIIIADDCSTENRSSFDGLVNNIQILPGEHNLGFLRNCNRAARLANGKYIVLLNNDTNVQPNWLPPLLGIVENETSIGLVGPMLLYPNGKIQEAGGIIFQDGSGWNYGHLDNPELPEYNYVKEVDYISGACILLPKALWDEIGGFDEHFAPAYYEDTDLAFEIRKRKLKVIYQPLSKVVHFEGISHGTDISSGTKIYQKTNQSKFYLKWNNILRASKNITPKDIFHARDRSTLKKTILYIDKSIPLFDQDAGSKITFQYLRLMVSLGYNVKFLADDFMEIHPYTRKLQQIGIEVFYGATYKSHWRAWLLKYGNKIDYVCLSRPNIAQKYLSLIKRHTHAKVIYFGHDLHYLREQRHYALDRKPSRLKAAQEWETCESNIMHNVDVSYFFSEYEISQIKNQWPTVSTKTIPTYLIDDQELNNPKKPFEERQGLLFVGGFMHEPNVDGIRWFILEILPLIRKCLPEISLTIVGSSPPKNLISLKDKGIIFAGRVSEDELLTQYQKCRLVVAPLRFGAGIKGKIIESMIQGIPTITTSIGAEGIENSNSALSIADNPKLFSEYLINVYTDKALWNLKAEGVLQSVERHASKEMAKQILLCDMPIN